MRNGRVFVAVIAASLLTLVGVASPQSPATIRLRSQDVRLPGPGAVYVGEGATLLNEHCLLCHSPTFVDTQPALSAKAWQAEVLKMQKAFGAPIDPAVIPELVKILLDRHGQPTTGEPTAGNAGGAG